MIGIKDIAAALGVSASTVSRALNDSKSISKERRLAIQEYARKHHYVPNESAMQLQQKKETESKIVAVILPQFTHHYFSCILTAAQENLTKNGYYMLAFQTNDNYEDEVRALEQLKKIKLAGVIMSMAKNTRDYHHIEDLVDSSIPFVFVDRICTGVDTNRIVVDDYMSAYIATEHLIRTGCKDIAFLGSPMNLEISKNRYNGYRDAMLSYRLSPRENVICDNPKEAERITPLLMTTDKRPDGFFCVNDETAIGVLYSCKHLGFKVPDDVSICGYSNSIRSVCCDPPLTTVEQRGHEVGKEAVQVILDELQGLFKKGIHNKRIVKTELVVRGTTRKDYVIEKVNPL